jgi:hypothetical protein
MSSTASVVPAVVPSTDETECWMWTCPPTAIDAARAVIVSCAERLGVRRARKNAAPTGVRRIVARSFG